MDIDDHQLWDRINEMRSYCLKTRRAHPFAPEPQPFRMDRIALEFMLSTLLLFIGIIGMTMFLEFLTLFDVVAWGPAHDAVFSF